MDNQHNPFQCNLGYQVSLSAAGEWKKKGDYIGREVLEKMKNGFPTGNIGQKFKAHLPAQYTDTPGVPVDAEVVKMPFTPSHYANIREKA